MIKILYLDKNNNLATEENATHFVVHEYDENGRLIKEEYGVTKNPWEIENQNKLTTEPSDEIKEALNNMQDKNGNYIFRK